MIPIPQIKPQMQKVPFSHVSYDSYIGMAAWIITSKRRKSPGSFVSELLVPNSLWKKEGT